MISVPSPRQMASSAESLGISLYVKVEFETDRTLSEPASMCLEHTTKRHCKLQQQLVF